MLPRSRCKLRRNSGMEYPRSLSSAKYIFVRKSVFFGYELKLLISTAGGRFPRAWLEPPCASHYGVSRLMLFPQDKEGSGSITSHEENRFVFSRSRRLPFQSTMQCFRL